MSYFKYIHWNSEVIPLEDFVLEINDHVQGSEWIPTNDHVILKYTKVPYIHVPSDFLGVGEFG